MSFPSLKLISLLGGIDGKRKHSTFLRAFLELPYRDQRVIMGLVDRLGESAKLNEDQALEVIARIGILLVLGGGNGKR